MGGLVGESLVKEETRGEPPNQPIDKN